MHTTFFLRFCGWVHNFRSKKARAGLPSLLQIQNCEPTTSCIQITQSIYLLQENRPQPSWSLQILIYSYISEFTWAILIYWECIRIPDPCNMHGSQVQMLWYYRCRDWERSCRRVGCRGLGTAILCWGWAEAVGRGAGGSSATRDLAGGYGKNPAAGAKLDSRSSCQAESDK